MNRREQQREMELILEQELDEEVSYCRNCGNVHSCSTACYYDDDEESGYEEKIIGE